MPGGMMRGKPATRKPAYAPKTGTSNKFNSRKRVTKPSKPKTPPRRRGKVIQMPGGYSARELKRRGR